MEFATIFVQLLLDNSPVVIDIVLMILVGLLLWERRFHSKMIMEQLSLVQECRDKYDEEMHEIIEKYYNENVEMIKALDEIKIVLSVLTHQNK